MPPYPAYRPSGVEWLGDVPEHWEVRRLNRSVARSDMRIEADDADGVPYVGLEHVASWTGRLLPLDEEQSPESLSNAFSPGDVLFGKLRPYLAKAFAAEFDGLCSTEFLVLNPFAYEQRYLLYAMLTDGFVSLVDSSTFGAKMPRANWDLVGATALPLPPLDEQRAIAAYLDRETERIDALVAKKRQLVERLHEYRTALITRTVTRGLPPGAARAAGLDPSPRLRPSGVEWLGDVPEHWEVGNIRRYAEMKSGHTPSRQHPEYWENCYIPWFTLADVWQLRDPRTLYAGETKELVSEVGIANSAAELLPTGTVMLSRTASIGFSGIMPVPMATSQHYWNWVCSPKLIPAYLLLTFRAMRPEFDRLMVGSTDRTIYEADAASFQIPVPPLGEQKAIAALLEERLPSTNAAVDTATLAIERLQEYRTALITAAVTGKIDVRESATTSEGPAE